MDFKDSQTYKNLQDAFAGEAQAYTKYQYYSSQAKKDGYKQISELFDETEVDIKIIPQAINLYIE